MFGSNKANRAKIAKSREGDCIFSFRWASCLSVCLSVERDACTHVQQNLHLNIVVGSPAFLPLKTPLIRLDCSPLCFTTHRRPTKCKGASMVAVSVSRVDIRDVICIWVLSESRKLIPFKQNRDTRNDRGGCKVSCCYQKTVNIFLNLKALSFSRNTSGFIY